jgi:hypothetical protein
MRQRKSMKGKHYQVAFTLGVQKKLYGTHLKFKILILYSWILFTTILRKVMTKNENSRPSGTCSIRKADFDNFVLYKAFKNSCEIPTKPGFWRTIVQIKHSIMNLYSRNVKIQSYLYQNRSIPYKKKCRELVPKSGWKYEIFVLLQAHILMLHWYVVLRENR